MYDLEVSSLLFSVSRHLDVFPLLHAQRLFWCLLLYFFIGSQCRYLALLISSHVLMHTVSSLIVLLNILWSLPILTLWITLDGLNNYIYSTSESVVFFILTCSILELLQVHFQLSLLLNNVFAVDFRGFCKDN